ncbi:MAG: hypothetical protein M1815_003562 [Lichina confinis]|nr:MAG: hypothetical protein M1815_003562 [Lichina confinis]
MLTSGFTNAPVTQAFIFLFIATSVLASITDYKHLFYLQVVPHLWRYKQAWRVFSWQTCYTNSTEVLFATTTLYQLRVIERLWGTRKYLSFILFTLPYTLLLPPFILATALRPLTFGRMNYLPAGPTPIIFALLAQYHAAIPHIYKYRIVTSSSSGADEVPSGILLSDKSTSYLLAAQLALSQLPGSALGAAVGWLIGYAWRRELLPAAARWRVPGWIVSERSEGERFEGLRRRLEGESARAAHSHQGSRAADGANARQRRTLGTQILDQFRGAF